ncbi:LuxR C-terminal-related transcriptional regulator [Dactylosporangium darangshiense]|uniref:LuxR C-terminal-related transcriptional regulator n=1 Tax=Dactylosporangium darangshiense TaxID=579108 RepID=UPI0031E9AD27
MTSPLVETKLFVPRPRRELVDRPRLGERLARGLRGRVTLVSAPAGFGKTTLLSGWLDRNHARRGVAWVSLDESDARPEVFWAYVIAALQRVVPQLGAGVVPLLQGAAPPIETVLATVVNELSVVPHDVDLVLDDYHLVDGAGVQAGMGFLVEHLPPQVHLVISTRADPGLPLARLRARGDLVEVRAADLRFTGDEAAAYLGDVAGLELSAGDVAALAGRTEGWIAALQLAALSMQGRSDVAGFIAGFAGDDRYIVDYLVEEVLGRQSDEVRQFLMRTSVLDRLCGALCDAVTGERGCKGVLEALDRANLFVVPLDDNRQWYRYHHLFADLLRARLLDERPAEVAELHRRASAWYDEHGEAGAAVRHALAAGDVERAAELVELAIRAMRQARQEATIRGWGDALPDAVVQRRPVLAAGLAGAMMAGGDFEGVEERLGDVERLLAAPGAEAMVVADAEGLDRLPGAIAMYRAALALARGDLGATLGNARLAIERAAAGDDLVRSGASGLAGLARWAGGDLDGAHEAYLVCVDGLQRIGYVPDVLGCSITLADIRATQGRLGEARRTYERALRLAESAGGPLPRGAADMHAGLAHLAVERDDLEAAAAHLRRCEELGEHAGLPQHPYRWRVATALLRAAQGATDEALGLLDDAQRVYTGDFSPNVRPIPALRARVLAAAGRAGEAARWADEHRLSDGDELSYLREFEHVTLARVRLAQHADPRPLLERLLDAADAGGRGGTVIEVLALLALARQAAGDADGALEALERALRAAEPEGYARVFTAEGDAMAALLRALGKRHPGWAYPRRLHEAAAPGPAPALAEPLSERELDVLRLLATDLDGPDIARRLSVSLNTLRTHTKNIYAKLGVNSRRAAVRQAAELRLLKR